jgi:TP901 family phage tail tape measure protein
MAAMTTVVKALIKADASQMKTQLQGASRSLDDFSKSAKETGRKLTRRLTLPLIGAGATAIKAASDFEASMTKIESLVGLSSEAVQGFTEDVRRLSGETAQAPKDLADAMFFITSAGLRGADAVETLEAAAKAAAVGLGETAVIADLATSALNAYGAENLSATQATDVMVAAVREGKLNADELAVSMGRVLPLASAMGVNFNEVGAAFAALSRTGTNASEAATQVRGILSSLLRPTKQARDALAGMGLSAEGLREELRQKGLLATLKTLSKEFAGNEAAAASVFGNIRALSGVLDLMGANVATTEQIFANMTDTTGTLDKAFQATSETAAFKLSQAMANLKGAFIDIGNVLIPIVVPILENLAGIIKTLADGFGKLPSPIQKTAVAMGMMAAAAGPATYAVGLLTGKGARGGLGGLLKIVKAHPKAMVAMGVAIGATALIMRGFRKRAQEARDRMEILRQEIIDSGDPTATLTARVKELATRLAELKGTAEEADPSIGNFVGSQTMLSELIKRDVVPQFQQLDIEMSSLLPLIEGGTDKFHELGDETKHLVREEDAFVRKLREADDAIAGVTNKLAEQIEEGKLTTKQARQIMIAIDETADAFDDYRKALEAEAKAYLTSNEGIIAITRSLGLMGANLLDAAGDSMTYVQAQEEIEKALQVTDTAINGNIGGFLGYNDVVKEAVPVTEEVTQRFRTFKATSKLTAEELQEVRNEFDKLVQQLNDVVENAFGFDSALLQVKETAVTLVEAIAGLNDEEKTQLEREAELLRASERYANALAGVGEELVALPVEEVNGFFAEQKTVLDDAFRSGELAEEEYRRLTGVLGELEQQVIDLNKRNILLDMKINLPTGVPQSFINMLFNADGQADIGGFVTDVAAGFTPMATGGIVTQPTLGLIGEAGPEAVIPLDRLGSTSGGHSTINITVQDADPTAVVNAIEKYVRENGSAPVATSTLTRR